MFLTRICKTVLVGCYFPQYSESVALNRRLFREQAHHFITYITFVPPPSTTLHLHHDGDGTANKFPSQQVASGTAK